MLCASCGGEQIAAPRAEERPAGDSLQADHLEDEVVCGAWTETYLTILWRFLAGGSDASRVAGLAGVERVSFVTADQRGLGGYRLRAYADPSRPPRGYVLIGPGNAMLADQVVGEFTFLQADGFDVYVYDHRGYGISEGKSRFAAILSDYIALIEHLNGQGYPSRLLYGMSLGGVFMLNAIGAGVGYDAVLIDSPPSRISDYGCPARLDPVANVPEDASRLGFIFGHRDKVVPPGAWRELAALARARGASVMERAELAHPLMDRTPSAHRARMAILRAFFTERAR
ncbi:MAG TPA: alpha/beta fold hydrolase [Geminicoccaceae bacterium]|nr:alpha/beta fold hydrolase [Geminicoccaceae bacterium]